MSRPRVIDLSSTAVLTWESVLAWIWISSEYLCVLHGGGLCDYGGDVAQRLKVSNRQPPGGVAQANAYFR
jgi:hypothetical protein